jgi:tetratricopeptide (TPR) repeat protein
MNEQEEANILLKELSYLPLAIALAAAYINANDIALKEYRLLLAQQEKETIEHLCEGFEDAGQYDRAKHPVATTSLISFEQIRRCNMLAVDYMSFMACVDRKDIPQSLLPVGPSREKGIAAIGSLHAYSMIVKRPAASAIDLHQLVHLTTRNWLQNQESLLARWTEAAITRLLDMFPDDNHGNRSKWRRLLPHAIYALKFGLIGEGNEARVGLVSKCAISLLSDGRYNEAEAYFLEMVQRDKRVFGEEHPDTLIRMGNLATTYTNQGRRKEAEELEVRVMETFKRVVGEGHPFTLTSMGNLASTYRDQGRWKEAEELDVRVMETRLRVLSEEHPSTLTSMDNLASTYRDQGRRKEAEVLGMRGVETSVKVLGEEHPDTLISMNNLARTYGNQGRWKKAEELNVAVLEIRKRVLGEEHPDTLNSMDNHASSYTNQGR